MFSVIFKIYGGLYGGYMGRERVSDYTFFLPSLSLHSPFTLPSLSLHSPFTLPFLCPSPPTTKLLKLTIYKN
jgi:hypothetical protein